jgi:hypothetical protein
MMLHRNERKVKSDALAVALAALGWAVCEPDRAQRMLAITGLDPDDLRARANDPQLLAAILGFVEAHEPDLIACADAIGVSPGDLVVARQEIER